MDNIFEVRGQKFKLGDLGLSRWDKEANYKMPPPWVCEANYIKTIKEAKEYAERHVDDKGNYSIRVILR